jgi:hypothetical protein
MRYLVLLYDEPRDEPTPEQREAEIFRLSSFMK